MSSTFQALDFIYFTGKLRHFAIELKVTSISCEINTAPAIEGI